jgi:hypothetical protein
MNTAVNYFKLFTLSLWIENSSYRRNSFLVTLFLVVAILPTNAFSSDSTFHIKKEIILNENIELNKPFTEGLLPAISSGDPIDSVKYYMDKAQSVISKIRETQNYISSLNDVSLFELPVGIPKLVNGLNYDIGIYAIRLMPTHAEVDVVMQFEIPQNGKVLTFHARGIKFTRAGGIVGDAKLALIGDYGINFSGDNIQLVVHGSLEGNSSYVTMDCDGFKAMGLDAEVKFSRDILVPEDQNGNVQAGNVSAAFNATLNNWNDLIVQLSLPSFQVTTMPGMGFSVRDAVLDFSDVRNAPSVKFPNNYNSDYADAALANLWRGVYIRELAVRLPPEFKNKTNTTRTSFAAYDLLIDHEGFTGTVMGANLISLNNGDMNGWAFSVDSIRVQFQKSNLIQAGFNGNIIISVAEEQTPLAYTAVINNGGNYLFRVASVNDMAFTIWGGSHATILPASYLEVRVQNKKFLPKAVLHGSMDIRAKLSEHGKGVELANISFENLQIQSVRPYISIGNFSFGSEALQQKMAGFPVSIENISMVNLSETEVGLNFNLLLNLTGESGGAFAADAGLTVIGSLHSEAGRQRWRYLDTEVRAISVDINGGAFKFKGSLAFYRNDVDYGDGFNGSVKAEFIPNIKVTATAIFGSVNGQRYWYADAMATFKPGILIFPGVAFYGFGGGAYYGMKMDKRANASPLGKTASGVVYVPDTNAGLGIKAIVSIGSAPTDKAFNGDVTLEAAFFRSGGLRTISLTGNAFIATPQVDDRLGKLTASVGKMADAFGTLEQNVNSSTSGTASQISAQESMIGSIHGDIGKAAGARGAISARAFIQYDFENRELHGNFSVNINVAGGLIQGHGDAVLHFAPKEWYVYVGTPDHRITLSFGIGPIRANATTYFMVGSKIPGSPPPPEEVSRILGGLNLDYMKDLNTIASGGGFAFGCAFDIDTGDLTFLLFYARFHAGAGFDIMLKNYGNTYCAGNNDRIGVNGWYANGQVYAFFTGDVGIRIKLFGVKKDVNILSIGAAVVLQAQFPNPFWMSGTVGGYYSVLDGMIKGNCRFSVTLGEKCELVKKAETSTSNILENIKAIAQLTPGAGETNINVFNTPQVVFNMPVEKEFYLSENDVARGFRLKLDYLKVSSENKELTGSMQWNTTQDVVTFTTVEVLPSKKTVKVSVQVTFQENKNGSWITMTENGQPLIEKAEVSFTTGPAPDYIPMSNIRYTYPVVGQLNFYKDETPEGYIVLNREQNYLFEPNEDFVLKGRFTGSTGEKKEFDFTHTKGTINFTIPSGSLKPDLMYTVELVNVPRNASGAIDRNVTEVTTTVDAGNESLDTEITNKQAEGTIETLQEKSIFTGNFKTSKYNTFAQKLDAMNVGSTLRALRILWRVHYLKTPFTLDEPFDAAELDGSRYAMLKPLIHIQADLTDNAYYNDVIAPLIYRNDSRRSEGNMTQKGSSFIQLPYSPELDYVNLTFTNNVTEQYLSYNMPYYYYQDFKELQRRYVQQYLSGSASPEIETIVKGMFPIIIRGAYKIKVGYCLPHKSVPSVTREIIIQNPVE